MAKVSVIMPNFNNEKFIKESIQSVLNQSLKDIEIIVIDDQSKDNSVQIVEEMAKNDSRIKIIKNAENSGAGVSRNNGIDIATGEYIKFLDSDDAMPLDTLEVMYDSAIKNNAKIVCGYIQFIRKNGEEAPLSPYSLKVMEMLDGKKVTPETPGSQIIYESVGIGDGLYKRELFEDIQFPNLKWEDLATIPLLKYLTDEILCINKSVYYYNDNKDGTSSTDRIKKTPRIMDCVKCFEILRRRLPEKYKDVIDKMECRHIEVRAEDVYNWRDCDEESKKKIISALFRVLQIDVPNYYEKTESPFAKNFISVMNKVNIDELDILEITEKVKKFENEPIDLSNQLPSNYDSIIRDYKHFCENIQCLQDFPESGKICRTENGKKVELCRSDIEEMAVNDLRNFYYNIKSKDFNESQKKEALENMYKMCKLVIPDAIHYLIIRDYTKFKEYLLPEFATMSKEEALNEADQVVRSPEFQKYPMSRMASKGVRNVPQIMIKKFMDFKESVTQKKEGR